MTDDKFRNQLLDVLVPASEPVEYKVFSFRLPIADYALLKTLSLELNKSPSDLGRSIFLVALEAAQLVSSEDD